MKRVLTRIALFSLLFFLLIPCPGFAGTKTFIKEYTYQASEDDSRNSSRVVALREVKRLLLEELGTYLESVTEVKNFQLTRDQITTLTAGIVQTEIIEEKWDGRVYWLKSKIVADEDKVVQSIDSLRKDREKTKELESMRLKSDELLRDNERLRKELASTKGGNREVQKTAYDRSIKELSSMEWLEKGYAAKDRRDFKKAIEAYSRAIELDPKNAPAYYSRARISDRAQATQDYYKLLDIEPNDSGAHLLRAWTYKELEKDDLALQEFGKAIERASGIKEKAEAYNDRGRYYSAIKQDENLAIQDFSRAIELDPKDGRGHVNRGQSYAALQRNDLAIQDYNKAIEIDPKNASAYSARGWLLRPDKPELAVADFSRAIELDRNESSFYYLPRAQVYEKLHNYDLAIRDYSKMLELEPDHIYVYNVRASLYAMVGRHDLALQDYSKTIELKPDQPSAYMDRGKYFAKYDKHTQAIKDYNMAVKLKPDYDAYVGRGFSYFKLGDLKLALKDYDKAVALNYRSPERVYYNRAMLYARERNAPKAVQDLRKAIQIWPNLKDHARTESEFDAIREHPDFVKLIGE